MSSRHRANISFSGSQIRGDRPYQEDAFDFLEKDAGVLALVADGCGGRPHARAAAQLAVQTFKQSARALHPKGNRLEGVEKWLRAWMANADLAVKATAANDGRGTTLIAAFVTATDLYYVSVGDSLLFVVHEGQLQLLPNQKVGDRSAVGLGVENMLTGRVFLMPGDQVLLATDGLIDDAGYVPELADHLRSWLTEAPREIVKAALDWAPRFQKKWGQDNCTVLCISAGKSQAPT